MSSSPAATFLASPLTKQSNSEIISELVNMQKARKCVGMTQKPSVQMYYILRQTIDNNSAVWLQEFLGLDGLQKLLDTICEMTSGEFTNFSDAILQLDCIACIRSIFNRKIGMEFALKTSHCVQKLVNVLNSGNTMPKKQIFEILTAVCMYSNSGLQQVMSALTQFKKDCGYQHKFSVLIAELTLPDVALTYKTAVLSFTNCLVNCHRDAYDRVRMRTQLAGLGLRDIISNLRRQEFDADIFTQIEIFENSKYKDDVTMEQQTRVDVDDSCQLFDLIYSKVFGGHRHTYFLQILQDLAMLEISQQKLSETKWEHIRDVVHRLVSCDDTDIVFNCPTYCHGQRSDSEMSESTIRPGDSTLRSPVITTLAMAKTILDLTPEKDASKLQKNYALELGKIDAHQSADDGKPFCEMLTFRWSAITAEMMTRYERTLWHTHPGDVTGLEIDMKQLEELFADGMVTDEWDEVQLVDSSIALKINLILHRLDASAEDLASSIVANDPSLNTWAVKCLDEALPSKEEVELLQSYPGPVSSLSQSDKLLLCLSISNSDYKLLIHAQSMVRQLLTSLRQLRTSVDTIKRACKQIMDSHGLPRFLKFILRVGNVLNYNKFNGRAVGFKLTTLSRLDDIKSVAPRMTLLRYLVSYVSSHDPTVFKFVTELSSLNKATKCNVEQITSEVRDKHAVWEDTRARLANLHTNTLDSIQPALETVNGEFHSLQSGLCEVKLLSSRLAQYFCEEEIDFNLSDCFQQLSQFMSIIQRYRLEMKMSKKEIGIVEISSQPQGVMSSIRDRRKTLEFGREAGASSSFMEDHCQIIETALSQVHRGHFHTPDMPLDERCVTPEQEELPWELSCISPSGMSPQWSLGVPLARVETFSEFNASQKCTSSANDLLCHTASTLPPNPVPAVTTPSFIRKLGTLYRSHSDLNLTTKVQHNWIKYENSIQQRMHRQISLEPRDQSILGPQSPAVLVCGPEMRLPEFKVPSKVPTYVNCGPVGNRLTSNFKRQYHGPTDCHDSAARGSKKRASIMGNIVNRLTKVVLKPWHEGGNEAKSRSRRDKKSRDGKDGKETKDEVGKVADKKKATDLNKQKNEYKDNCGEENKENLAGGRMSLKMRFSRGKGKSEDVKGVMWANVKGTQNVLCEQPAVSYDFDIDFGNEKLV